MRHLVGEGQPYLKTHPWNMYTPRSLTWNLKMMVSKFGISFSLADFQVNHVKLQGCIANLLYSCCLRLVDIDIRAFRCVCRDKVPLVSFRRFSE